MDRGVSQPQVMLPLRMYWPTCEQIACDLQTTEVSLPLKRDAEAATWSAVANFDSAAIYRSWVRSMLDNQAVNCATPSICGQVSGIPLRFSSLNCSDIYRPNSGVTVLPAGQLNNPSWRLVDEHG